MLRGAKAPVVAEIAIAEKWPRSSHRNTLFVFQFRKLKSRVRESQTTSHDRWFGGSRTKGKP